MGAIRSYSVGKFSTTVSVQSVFGCSSFNYYSHGVFTWIHQHFNIGHVNIGFSNIHACSSKADELISLPHCSLMFFNALVESVFCLADIEDWAASTCNSVHNTRALDVWHLIFWFVRSFPYIVLMMVTI